MAIINHNKVDLQYQPLNGQNAATRFSAVYLFSDNYLSDGWVLGCGPQFITNPINNPTITIDGTVTVNLEIPFNSSWGDYYVIVATPSEANRKSILIRADGQTMSADILSDVSEFITTSFNCG